ncbi:hypothetical protein GGX14DRAFT_593043 [Mycena pura]|uniref:Uncharacterized protein n=1 Tax=Mycena pura TaxID=153505 RepID=A0AAD6Y296_9AGAR|nr:hypothetical protein GGX14DRAFT_593043 [Mycena pura]
MSSTTFPEHTDSRDSLANSPMSFGSAQSPQQSPLDNTAQREVSDAPHPVPQDFIGFHRPITVDNRSTPILCNSNRPALSPLARIGSSSDIRSRRQAALDLGSRVFHKPWLKTAVPATRRMFRMVFSDELQLLESLLTEFECAPSRDHSQFGYRVQQHTWMLRLPKNRLQASSTACMQMHMDRTDTQGRLSTMAAKMYHVAVPEAILQEREAKVAESGEDDRAGYKDQPDQQ